MPVTPTYPGVYIEELPSGVHTITGVATSIAAFVGWAAKGPVDHATLILSWSDFEREFGGLDSRSLLGYSVNQFFANGGQQAYIVRLVSGDAHVSSITIGASPKALTVNALSAGKWANDYQVAIKNSTASPGRFQFQVLYAPTGATPAVVESFPNLSISALDPQGRYVVDVLANSSNFVSVTVPGTTTTPPDDATAQLGGTTAGADGTVLTPSTAPFETGLQAGGGTGGVNLLGSVDLFNLLCVPGEINPTVLGQLDAFCKHNQAFLIADSNPGITDFTNLSAGPGFHGDNSAFYFPSLLAPDPLAGNVTRTYPPCGFVAGIYATTDANRGVWKAPAGTETALVGVSGVTVPLTDKQNGVLNPVAVNCIRTFSAYGTVVWGARTTGGNDEAGSQWKYVPIRRLALFLETSLYRGTQWVVFEPNDAPLWSQIRLNVGAFMQTLFRQGAFQGSTPQQAYFVKCDSETTTSTDQNNGIVNILVGFAPLKPAEFVIIQIQQIAGQTAV
jgi:phage tail sheath protein FI